MFTLIYLELVNLFLRQVEPNEDIPLKMFLLVISFPIKVLDKFPVNLFRLFSATYPYALNKKISRPTTNEHLGEHISLTD